MSHIPSNSLPTGLYITLYGQTASSTLGNVSSQNKSIYEQALAQDKFDKNKAYRLH